MSKDRDIRHAQEFRNGNEKKFSDYLKNIHGVIFLRPHPHTIRELDSYTPIPIFKMLKANKRASSKEVYGVILEAHHDIYGIEPSGAIRTRIALGEWCMRGSVFAEGKELMLELGKPLQLKFRDGDVQSLFRTQQYNGSISIPAVNSAFLYEIDQTSYKEYYAETDNLTSVFCNNLQASKD